MSPSDEPGPYTTDQWKEIGTHVLEAWKKTVDVQVQFNDIELRIRNYAITVLVAIVGAAALAMKEHYLELSMFGRSVSIAVPLLGAGLVSLVAFYFMDRFWYHRLLQGAVEHGRSIERRCVGVCPAIGLGNKVKQESPFKLFWLFEIHSETKIDIFYFVIAVTLVIMMLAFAFGSSSY
jgi:hypothetical protein